MATSQNSTTHKQFRFTSEQWNRLLSTVGNPKCRPKHRKLLEQFVDEFLTNRLHPLSVARSRDEMRIFAARASELCNKLEQLDPRELDLLCMSVSTEICFPPRIVNSGAFDRWYQRSARHLHFVYFYLRLASFQATQLATMHDRDLQPNNVDAGRNLLWELAARGFYEPLSGKKMNVSVNPRGEEQGPFVRFIQALMSALPAEPQPTGSTIRAFVRSMRQRASPPVNESRCFFVQI
jgi:hypothetical protein